MKRSLSTVCSLLLFACAGITVLVALDGCQSTQTSSGTQEVAKPVPPPPPPAAPEPPPPAPEPPPPMAAPEPPPPPPAAPQQEMVAQAAAAPTEDPLAWASGLEDVLFDYDKSAIRKSEQGKLAAAAKALKDDKKRKVLVEGHCDERGTSNYNLALGERRAKAVKKYLADLGVAAAQIQTTSYGKERPLCRDQSEDCYQRNRRGHFAAQ